MLCIDECGTRCISWQKERSKMNTIFTGLKKIIPLHIFFLFQPFYHFFMAWLAAVFYGFPSRKLIVIGVTGTKGKTTVVELLHEIFASTDVRVASLSSLQFRVGNKEERNMRKMTMPGRFFIQKFLHRARRAGCKYVVLEVTSEGIKQFRHRFIKFDAVALTNVSPEHIEAHGNFEKYVRAKLDLFWRLAKDGVALINLDDPNWQRFAAATASHKLFYGRDEIVNGSVRYKIDDIKIQDSGISFDIGGVSFNSPLLGEFNFYNILAAVSLGLSQHIPLEKMAIVIPSVLGIPGRMEFIQKEPFAVVVDYAHTPDSLRNVYTFLRGNPKSEIRNPKLICVLGSAGGGRDSWKRSEFGKIAAEFCDETILTNEDPYDENPQSIIDEIASGFSQSTKRKAQSAKKILDRREAILEALKSAKPGDTVLITGKGAEPWIMGPKGEKIPWDDREIVRGELEKLKKAPLGP